MRRKLSKDVVAGIVRMIEATIRCYRKVALAMRCFSVLVYENHRTILIWLQSMTLNHTVKIEKLEQNRPAYKMDTQAKYW